MKKILISKTLDPLLLFHRFFLENTVAFPSSLFILRSFMPMLRELFDLCMLKAVPVASLLIEQAPSFSKLNFVICIKPSQSGQQNPTVLGEMLFIHQAWEVDDFSSILTWFWKSIPNTSAYGIWYHWDGLRQLHIEMECLNEVSGIKTLAVYSPFYFSDSHWREVLVNQNVSVNLKISRELCMLWGSGLDLTVERRLLFPLTHNES